MSAASPANLLVVMSDQHAPTVLGCAGHPYVSTPSMDALARAGTRFTAASTPSPICVPARAAWATGRPVHEIGCWDNAMAYDGRVPSWGHRLQAAGHRVESIGKLHYRAESDPTGFDHQTEPMHVLDGIGQVWGSVRDPLPVKHGAPMLVAFSGPGDTNYTRYDARTTDHACRWLREDAPRWSERPWTLYVGLVAPHHPYVAPETFYERYADADLPRAKLHPLDGHERHPWVAGFAGMLPGLDTENSDEERRRCTASYYALVSYLDHNLGRILDALADTGLDAETRVVYTSDHGDTVGTRGLWGKSVLYQESAGIPLVVAGPGVPAEQERATPVSLLDGFPTVLDATGAPAGEGDDELPGRSWLALADEPDDPERVVVAQYHAMGAPSAAFMVRRGRWKYHHYVGDYDPELFDLAADPDEAHDLGTDPAHAEVRGSLEAALRAALDPDEVDARARADQAALVERFGGPARAAELGTLGETPTPDSGGRSERYRAGPPALPSDAR